MLVKVGFTTGQSSQSVPLVVDAKLVEARKKLSSLGFMKDGDLFLNGGAEIAKTFEEEIKLSEIIIDNTIIIGHSEVVMPMDDDTEVDWRKLNNAQKNWLLNTCQVARGITLKSNEELATSVHDLFSWTSLPSHTAPRITTSESSSFSFSKVMREVHLITSDKLSLNLNTPFLQAESEYKLVRERTAKTEDITSYMLQKYIVSKENIAFTPSQIVPSEGFVLAINNVFAKKDESDKDKFCYLLHALNEWGFHIPIKFTLGGALYSAETTKVSDYSQVFKETEEFSVSAKAKYEGFGGSAGSGTSSQSQSTGSTSNKYENVVINQIGGKPGMTHDKNALAASLGNALRWRIVNVEEFYPSLMLLNGYKNPKLPNLEPQLLLQCNKLLYQYLQFVEVTNKIQPFVNISNYLTTIQSLISPW